jgi:hypothetical protein
MDSFVLSIVLSIEWIFVKVVLYFLKEPKLEIEPYFKSLHKKNIDRYKERLEDWMEKQANARATNLSINDHETLSDLLHKYCKYYPLKLPKTFLMHNIRRSIGRL